MYAWRPPRETEAQRTRRQAQSQAEDWTDDIRRLWLSLKRSTHLKSLGRPRQRYSPIEGYAQAGQNLDGEMAL